MYEKRVKELATTITAFGKDMYYRSELLPEMLGLQQEIADIFLSTFQDISEDAACMKLYEVENYLHVINEKCGNVANEELQRFTTDCHDFCNLIRAEISGTKGESKVFRTLEYLKVKNIVLKNVELNDGDKRTEIDALVITPAGITIVEVKNTGKNIFIDEEGNYYRTGEYLRLDCNIAEKMAIKEELMKKTLENAGIVNIPIQRVVVFTNNNIEVHNKYSDITVCFMGHLNYIIQRNKTEILSIGDMEQVKTVIEGSICRERYPFEFDVEQFKCDFATVVAILEHASIAESEEVMKEEKKLNQEDNLKNNLKEEIINFFSSEKVRHASGIVACIALSMVSGVMTTNLFKK